MEAGLKFWHIRPVSWNRIVEGEGRITIGIYPNRQDRVWEHGDTGRPWGSKQNRT